MFWVFLFFLSVSSLVEAAALISDGTDHIPEPTHCAFYFDGDVLSDRTPVVDDTAGFPGCYIDLDFIQPGSHTVRASFQIDDPVWGITEGPLSDPFDFVRPISAENLPAPVLRIGLSVGEDIVVN